MKKKPTKKRGGWRPGSGRPKAGRTLARDGSATLLRFYPEERELMEEAAQYMGYTQLAPFLRHCALHMSKEVLGRD